MTTHHTIIGAFPSDVEANSAVRELQKTGFDIQKLSLARTVLPPSSDAGFLPGRMPSSAVGLTFVLLASESDEDALQAQETLQNAGYLTHEAIQYTGLAESAHPPHPPGARLHPAGDRPPYPPGTRPPHPAGVHSFE